MAITATVSLTGDWLENLGNRRSTSGSITTSSTYVTGGFAITAANLGLGVLEYLDVQTNSGWLPVWDKTNGKIQLFESTTGAPALLVEAANGATIAITILFKAFGR